MGASVKERAESLDLVRGSFLFILVHPIPWFGLDQTPE